MVRRVTYSVEVEVIKLQSATYHFGEKHVIVLLAYQVPVPMPPHLRNTYPPPPKAALYYHVIELRIPEEDWEDQYRIGQKFIIKVYDDGSMELRKK